LYLTIFDRLQTLFTEARDIAEVLAAKPTAEYDAKLGDPELFLTLAFSSFWGICVMATTADAERCLMLPTPHKLALTALCASTLLAGLLSAPDLPSSCRRRQRALAAADEVLRRVPQRRRPDGQSLLRSDASGRNRAERRDVGACRAAAAQQDDAAGGRAATAERRGRRLRRVDGSEPRSSATPYAGHVELHRIESNRVRQLRQALLGLDVDPGLLPVEDQQDGFDNIAKALQVSPSFVEQYLEAARTLSATAVGNAFPRPVGVSLAAGNARDQQYHIPGLPLRHARRRRVRA
jgi:hypothetical protein